MSLKSLFLNNRNDSELSVLCLKCSNEHKPGTFFKGSVSLYSTFHWSGNLIERPHEEEDGESDGGDKDTMRRERQHKDLTDSRSEEAIVHSGLTSSPTDHEVTRTAAAEEAGISLTSPCSRWGGGGI